MSATSDHGMARDVDARAGATASTLSVSRPGQQPIESWLDKRGLATYLQCSIRSIENAVSDGLPHAIIFGRAKFRASEVEAWLETTGRLERRGTLPARDERTAA
jgi:hypothetical protein